VWHGRKLGRCGACTPYDPGDQAVGFDKELGKVDEQ